MSNLSKRQKMRIFDVFRFGKYKNQDLVKIIDIDPGYIRWCVENDVVQFEDEVLEELKSLGVIE